MMKQRVRRIGTAIAALCVIISAAAGVRKPYDIDQTPDASYRYPLVTAPLFSGTLPKIDGTVNDAEWSGAARTMPLLDRITGAATQDEAVCWFAYAESGIYIAFRVIRPAFAERPKALSADGGDYMAIYICDKFGRKYGTGVQLDAYGNRRTHDLGVVQRQTGIERQWLGQSRLIPNGYEGEIFLPFSFFERRTPREDDIWELQIYNVRETPDVQMGAFSVIDQQAPLAGFGYLRFGGPDTPAVQMMPLHGDQQTGLGAMVELGNSPRPVTVQAALFAPRSPGLSYYQVIKDGAALTPEEAGIGRTFAPTYAGLQALRHFRLIEKWADPVEPGARIMLGADVPPGEYLLHTRVIGHDNKLLAAGTWGMQHEVDLAVRTYLYPLLGQQLAVLTDFSAMPAIARGQLRLDARLLDAAGTVVRQRVVDANLITRLNRLELPLAEVRPATYTLSVQLLHGAAEAPQVLATNERQVTIPPTPPWRGNTIGAPERLRQVPAPWTPIRSTADAIEVWGRTIDFNNRNMPTSITHSALGASNKLLADPMALQINTGQELAYGATTVTREPWRIIRSADLNSFGGSLRGRLTVETEFDGFMKYRLVLSPVGSRPVPISGLTLDIPLRRSLVTHYHAGQSGTRINMQPPPWQAGAVPAEGLTLPFTSNLWLGNQNAGLDFTMEWDRFWFPLDQPDAITLRFEDERAMLRVNMVRRDTSGPQARVMTITEPVVFEWGLLPTPSKPMSSTFLRDFRLVTGESVVNRMSRRIDSRDIGSLARALANEGATAHLTIDPTPQGTSNATVVWPADQDLPGMSSSDPNAPWRLQGLQESIANRQRQGIRWNLFRMYGRVPVEWPELNGYWHEMVETPEANGGSHFHPAPTSAFQDWYLHRLKQTIDATRINGIYQMRTTMPRLSASVADGSAWYDERGRLRGRYPVFALRRLQQRIWLTLHAEGPAAGALLSENYSYIYPAVESFTDVHVAGHYVGWLNLLQNDRDALLSRYYGRPFGVPVIAFNSNEYNQPATRLQTWGPALLLEGQLQAQAEHLLVDQNPALIRKTYDDPDAIVIAELWKAWRTFPWNAGRWIPWWQINTLLTLEGDGLLAAAHLAPGQEALIAIVNPSNEPLAFTATLDLSALQLSEGTFKIIDVVHQQELRIIDGNRIEGKVLPASWRYLRILPLSK